MYIWNISYSNSLIQAARIIGTGLAGVGIGVVFGALILGVARNPSLRGPLFSYAISFSRYLLRCNLALIILTIFLVYYFPIIGKSSFNIINLLGYITIALGVGCIRSKSNHLDLSKLLFISFKNAMFSLLNIKNIKIRLIYLILILPLLLAIFGDYTYLFLNFGLIFNNVNMLLNFMINGNDKFLSKIWESFFFILFCDIIILGFFFFFKDSPFLLTEEPSGSENGNSNSNELKSNSNSSNPNLNPNNSDFIYATESNQKDDGFINVLTTLPDVEGELPVIHTDRLIIRAPAHSDLDAYYSLRSQPEAMTDSERGRPDANLSVTLKKLECLIKRDKDSVYFFIFLKNSDGSEGVFIGDGGVHNFKSDSTGLPEFGYKFKKEFWGQGYGTEFGKAFMEFWGNLPRKNVEIPVAPSSIDNHDSLQVIERLTAYTRNENLASQNVLRKLGFKSFEGLKNGLINWRKLF